jgi:hypothetical protein
MARFSARTWIITGAVVVVAILFAALFMTIAKSAWQDWRGEGGLAGADYVVSGPRDGWDTGTFELLSSATSVTVRATDLGDQLYRVATPDGGAKLPRVTVNGDRVLAELVDQPDRGGQASTVDIQLSREVRWKIRFVSGATEQLVNFGGGQLDGIDFVAGVSRIEMTLPKPNGTVPIRMSGGTSQWVAHLPDGVPARVVAGGGASSVTIDGQRRTGLSGGTIVTSDGWAQANDRYDLDAAAGVSTVVVDRT